MTAFAQLLNDLSVRWWAWMVPMTWQVALLGLVVLTVSLVARRSSPRLRYLLWLVVLAKLVLPPTLAFYTGIGQLLPAPRPAPVAVQRASESPGDIAARYMWPGYGRAEGPVSTARLAPPPAPSLSPVAVAFVVWALGALALLAALVYQCLRMCVRVTRAKPLEDPELLHMLSLARDACGARTTVRVRTTDSLSSPVVFGLLRPVLLLPERTIQSLTPDQLRAVLTHELCHIRRGDLWVNWFQALALSLYWFHPVVWIGCSRLRVLREEIVDDMVLSSTGVSADCYGTSLLNVLRGAARRRLVAPGYVGIAEDGSTVKRRVARIMDTNRAVAARIGILSAAVVVAVALVMLPQARQSESKDTKPQYKDVQMPTPIKMTPPPDNWGNIHARGMSTILSYLGTEISYDRAMGLSGAAFVLQVETSGPYVNGELDAAWWPNDDWGFELGLPLLSMATGWELHKIGCDMDTYKQDPAAMYRKTFAEPIEKSLSDGKPVLCYGFIGTATDDEEPPLVGFGTSGKSTQYSQGELRVERHPWFVYLVGGKADPANATEVDMASLRHIIDLYNEEAQPADAPNTRFSGRQAWQEWLELLRSGQACDNNMLIHLRYSRGSAVPYLREMASRYTGEAAEHLDAAADLYEQSLADVKKEPLPYASHTKGPEAVAATRRSYTAMVERVARREAQAVLLLAKALEAMGGEVPPVKTGRAAPTGKSDRAAQPAIRPAQVKRDGDTVMIEGVRGWAVWDKESSLHAAKEAIMHALGSDVTYDYLVGVSGLAFRMQLHKDGICPSSPSPYCGYSCVSHTVEALPVQVTMYMLRGDEVTSERAVRAAVVESIDNGIPVQYGSEEDGVIVGYRKGGAEWLCYHPFKDGGRKLFVETKLPWGVGVHAIQQQPVLPKEDLVKASLQLALEMAATPDSGDYHVGYHAWDEYIALLKKLATADEETRGKQMQGNAWTYECLAQFRSCAASYLRDVAPLFDEKPRGHLVAAAELYDKLANTVLRDNDHCVTDIAPYPWMLKDGAKWTAYQLNDQIRRLEEALPLERKALGEIGEAVAAISDQS